MKAQLGAHRLDNARRVAARFLDALTAGKLHEARGLSAAGFTWFGRELAPEDWQGEAIRAFTSGAALTWTNLRDVPGPILMALPDPRAALTAPLGPEDDVFLADLSREGRTVTAALTVSEGKRVSRLFDPTELKAQLANAKRERR